jgi:hypothetical protein
VLHGVHVRQLERFHRVYLLLILQVVLPIRKPIVFVAKIVEETKTKKTKQERTQYR